MQNARKTQKKRKKQHVFSSKIKNKQSKTEFQNTFAKQKMQFFC